MARPNDIASIILTFTLMYVTTECARILVVFPFPALSHTILGHGYVKPLIEAGHEVTYITPHPFKDELPNLRQIQVHYPDSLIPSNQLNFELILKREINTGDFTHTLNMVHEMAQICLRQDVVQQLINDPEETFDLVIVEWMYTEIYSGFSAVFQCPLIWSSSMDPHWMILKLIDEVPNSAYVPDFNSVNVPPLSFIQRVTELWTQLKISYYKLKVEPSNERLYEEIFVAAGRTRDVIVPPLSEVKYNASLILSNSHASLGEPVRLPQNVIPIAGYHIDPKPKPLPDELQQIMNSAKNGVIYFSMGSNLKSKDLPHSMKRELLKTFSQLDQTVIWKFEEKLSNLPKNVHIVQWAPQPSILAHPNCVLFITHGGLLSITETVYYGVPIIGIPVFADQFININRAVNRGFAQKVDLSYDTPKKLASVIAEVLNNPSYRERVKYLSLIYHDRPTPPSKQLVHWVEHVVNTRGAPHLRSRALMTPWYQKLYLDLAVIVASIIYCLYLTITYVAKLRKPINITKKSQ